MFFASIIVLAAAFVAVQVHRRTNWTWFLSRSSPALKPGSYVLITGCDSGFGRQTAIRLASQGFLVLAGCLQEENARSLATVSSNIDAFVCDVTIEKDREACMARVERLGKGKLCAVVNNAGISDGYIAEWTDLSVYRRVMDINFFAAVAFTQACLPHLRATKGRVVNLSSAAGFFPNYGMAAYTASKHAIAAYSDALRAEVADQGVSVSTIMPGFAKTKILMSGFTQAERVAQRVPMEVTKHYPNNILAGLSYQMDKLQKDGSDPELTVDAIVHAVTSTHPKARYVVGVDANVLRFIAMLPAWIVDRLVVMIVHRSIKLAAQARS